MKGARAALALLVAGSGACSTLKVETQFDPNAPFASYRTYAWLATEPGAQDPAPLRIPAVRKMVITAVDRELAAKGMVRTIPDSNPDFLVSVMGAAQSRIEITTYGYPYFYPVADVSQYTEGTLVVHFVDAKSRQLFWRGIASDTVASETEVQGKIDTAVHEMLAAYPPKK